MKINRVVVGVDHGGFVLRELIVSHLESRGLEVTDLGVFSEESVDYPDIAALACARLIDGSQDIAVLACGTGIGISIAANKHPGVRCAVVHDLYTAEMARAHNDANAIAFGGRVEYRVRIEEMLDHFLETDFQGGRHERRVGKIARLDSAARR